MDRQDHARTPTAEQARRRVAHRVELDRLPKALSTSRAGPSSGRWGVQRQRSLPASLPTKRTTCSSRNSFAAASARNANYAAAWAWWVAVNFEQGRMTTPTPLQSRVGHRTDNTNTSVHGRVLR